jgi:hypothetical protein
VASVDDQQPVEAFRTDCSDEALRDGIRLRRSHRSLQDPDATAAEDLVEAAAVLAVTVADQEADALFGEVKTEAAGLPPLGFLVRPASQCSPLARVQELAPARSCAPRRRIESRPSKKAADACRR